MSEFWGNFLIEIGLFTLLGVLYYFYQKKKILKLEANKGPIIMGYILQSFLSERGEEADPEMDPIIEALDDYLHNRALTPPTALLKQYASTDKCSRELRAIIEEGLKELG